MVRKWSQSVSGAPTVLYSKIPTIFLAGKYIIFSFNFACWQSNCYSRDLLQLYVTMFNNTTTYFCFLLFSNRVAGYLCIKVGKLAAITLGTSILVLQVKEIVYRLWKRTWICIDSIHVSVKQCSCVNAFAKERGGGGHLFMHWYYFRMVGRGCYYPKSKHNFYVW